MSFNKITPEELYAKMQKKDRVFLMDVRAEEKYNMNHIELPGTECVNIPKNLILEGHQESLSFPEKEEVIVVCTTGNSASRCADVMSQKRDGVLVLNGGITAWQEFLKTR